MRIQNKLKTIQTFNIPHNDGCGDGAECLCQTVSTHLQEELPDGTKGTRTVERKLPGSLTFLGGETKNDVPEWVVGTKPLKRALASGKLRLLEE